MRIRGVLLLTLLSLLISHTMAQAAKIPKDIDALIRPVLLKGANAKEERVRAAAVEALGQLKGKEILAVLKQALTDPSANVRKAAIIALIKQKKKKDYTGVLIADLANPALDVITHTADILLRLPKKEAIAVIVNAIDNKKMLNAALLVTWLANDAPAPLAIDTFVKGAHLKNEAAALHFKKQIGSLKRKSLLPLLQKLINDRDSKVKLSALNGLKNLHLDSPLKFLRKQLKNKRDTTMRQQVALLLGLQGDVMALPVLKEMLKALPNRRKEILHSLLKVADATILEDLKTIMKGIKDPEEISLMYTIMARVGDASVRTIVKKGVKAENIEIRGASVRAYARIAGKEALPALYGALFDTQTSIRLAAAIALQDAPHEQSIPHLEKALRETDPVVKIEVIKAIAAIKTPKITNTLQSLAMDPNADIRFEALTAVASVANRDALPVISTFMGDTDQRVRELALKTLLKVDPKQGAAEFKRALSWLQPKALVELAEVVGKAVIPTIKEALHDSRIEVRHEAIKALRSFPKENKAILLQELKTSKFDDVKREAIKVLSKAKDVRAITIIVKFIEKRDTKFIEDAITAIGTMQLSGSVDTLTKLLSDADVKIQVLAASAIANSFK